MDDIIVGGPGLWVGQGGVLRAIGREGEAAPGTNGGQFRAFTSVAMPGAEGVFFTGKLKSGVGGVSKGNALGLWVWNPTGTRLALRSGQSIDLGSGVVQVSSFTVLSLVSGAPGHGHYDAAEQSVNALLKLSDGSVAMVVIDTQGNLTLVTRTGVSDETGRTPVKFGTPSSAGQGHLPVAVVSFAKGPGGITKENNTAVLDFETREILAQKGSAAPGAGIATFGSFETLVAGLGPEDVPMSAFVATLRGALPPEDIGLGAHTRGADPALKLARKGGEAPGTAGARFKSFSSLTLVEGRGPLFEAKLVSGDTVVTAANDRGVWATDSTGVLRLLLREGDPLGGKTVRSFQLLRAVPGSPASAAPGPPATPPPRSSISPPSPIARAPSSPPACRKLFCQAQQIATVDPLYPRRAQNFARRFRRFSL